RVLRSYEPLNRWVKVEEYVEGKNLTELRKAERTDLAAGTLSEADYKDVISTYVKCFLNQVLNRRTHADATVGNLRVGQAADGSLEVNVLDRALYQDISERELMMLKRLISGKGSVSEVVDYLLTLDRNAALRPQRDAIL